jgi:GT2 family glycosyltransferase
MESMWPQSERLKLVVCIAAHNVCELLRQCLQSVFASSTTFPFRVVVNDDGSSDGTCQMVAREFPQVDLMRNETPVGFARANNQMLRRHEGEAEYYLLLNDDTAVEPSAFQELVEFLDFHPKAGIAGGKLVKPNGVLDWACKRSFPTPAVFLYRALGLDRLFPRSRRFAKYQLTYLDENEVHEVDTVCGALLATRAEVIRQIGLLDEQLFMYGEDIDWCYRAKRAGWKVFYYPGAKVVHHKSQSIRKRSYLMIYWWYKALWIVYRKNVGDRYLFPINWAVWGGLQAACAVSLGLNLLRSEKRLPSRQ